MPELKHIPAHRLTFEPELIAQFQEGCAKILMGKELSNGEYVEQFEEAFARFCGVKYAVAASSGTVALELALRAIGVEGKDVIIPTNTMPATVIAAERAGARALLTDIESATKAMDPDHLNRLIHRGTGAVVLVHIGGAISAQLKEIMAICDYYGVPLIEDAAQAHGATKGELKAGAIGKLGCFSFYPTKVMTTGEGGMVTTDDHVLDYKLRSLREFGRDLQRPGYVYDLPGGLNGKMTEFQGLLGSLELQRVRARIEQRAQRAQRYKNNFVGVDDFVVNTPEGSSYYKVVIDLPDWINQSSIRAQTKAAGIELTGEVYRMPVHMQPAFRSRYDGKFPIAERFAARHICPPVYPELSLSDVDYVCEIIRALK